MMEVNRLRAWMDEQGYSIKKLAEELGTGYYGVYLVIHRGRISPGFRGRFTERFGADIANKIFDPYGVAQRQVA